MINWLYTVSNPFDFRGSRTDDGDSATPSHLGTSQGFFSGLYDGWGFIDRKLDHLTSV